MEMPVPPVLVPSVVASPGVVAAAVKGELNQLRAEEDYPRSEMGTRWGMYSNLMLFTDVTV